MHIFCFGILSLVVCYLNVRRDLAGIWHCHFVYFSSFTSSQQTLLPISWRLLSTLKLAVNDSLRIAVIFCFRDDGRHSLPRVTTRWHKSGRRVMSFTPRAGEPRNLMTSRVMPTPKHSTAHDKPGKGCLSLRSTSNISKVPSSNFFSSQLLSPDKGLLHPKKQSCYLFALLGSNNAGKEFRPATIKTL